MASTLIDLKAAKQAATCAGAFWGNPVLRFFALGFGAAAPGVVGRTIPLPHLTAEIRKFPDKAPKAAHE